MATPEKDPPRFESLPPEIRNMIYYSLLPPAELVKIQRENQSVFYWNPYEYQYNLAMRTAKTALLRANHNIYLEASAVLYRDLYLVAID